MHKEGRNAMADRNEGGKRRGFLSALGLGGAAAAAAVAAPALAQRADSVPSRDARKENAQARTAQRYQPNSADVQAFYRTNRYEH
jgi:hypothetical protein